MPFVRRPTLADAAAEVSRPPAGGLQVPAMWRPLAMHWLRKTLVSAIIDLHGGLGVPGLPERVRAHRTAMVPTRIILEPTATMTC
jgi:hypothetical protein